MTKYIVNHGGVVHSVNDEEFKLHLGMASLKPTEENPAGSPAREAKPEEVAAWWAAQGLVYLPETGEAVSKEEAAARAETSKASGDKPAK